MSNRSESNKPLPRKQRVINRGYLYTRKNENVKNAEVTLKQGIAVAHEKGELMPKQEMEMLLAKVRESN